MAQGQSGWIKYYPNWDLDHFLEKHKPSEEKDPNVFWISVDAPRPPGQQQRHQDQDLTYVSSYWNELVKSESRITAEDIKAIAAATGYTSGKWLVFRKPGLVDEVWRRVAKATAQGMLGTSAKVSSRSSSQTTKDQSHVICVFTQDFTDQQDILRVEQHLRELGIEGQISYKADIYTTLGIYFSNPWGLKPTLYTSRE